MSRKGSELFAFTFDKDYHVTHVKKSILLWIKKNMYFLNKKVKTILDFLETPTSRLNVFHFTLCIEKMCWKIDVWSWKSSSVLMYKVFNPNPAGVLENQENPMFDVQIWQQIHHWKASMLYFQNLQKNCKFVKNKNPYTFQKPLSMQFQIFIKFWKILKNLICN